MAWAELLFLTALALLTHLASAADPYVFYDWNVSYVTLAPLGVKQQVIAINGMFPGPVLNSTTNNNVVVNVQNNLDEPLLFTWDGIQMRRNSWEDGVSGTNCPIPPGQNWTYGFQVKDQIGSYFYWPTTMFQKAAGGYGGIIVTPRKASGVHVPFGDPDGNFVIMIGDWYTQSHQSLRASLDKGILLDKPDGVLINGKGAFNSTPDFEKLTVVPGLTYRLRISNVGIATSLNFRIQNHQLYLVETEGSYTSQQYYDSLDIHVGQSYSVLVTANQNATDYYIVASPRFVNLTIYENITGIAVLHYSNSTSLPSGPLPDPPNMYDTQFSQNQARSIRRNLTTGAARPNPQGSFHYGSINITQTFQLYNSAPIINGRQYFAVNDFSYLAPQTPLKLADYYNKTNVFAVDLFPAKPLNTTPTFKTSVISGLYQGYMEIILQNTDNLTMQSWHVDGYSVFVVGYESGIWTEESRQEYNRWDAISRSTIQVYPSSWTAILISLDNVGMWNIRSQILQQHYLGQELYMRVYNPEKSLSTELPPPSNVLYCGDLHYLQPPPSSSKSKGSHSSSTSYLTASALYNAFLPALLVLAWCRLNL